MDGFLAAVLAGPVLVPPSDAMGFILGEVPDAARPELESMAEVKRLVDLIIRHWNAIARGLERGDYEPVLATINGRTLGNKWADGFVSGMRLSEPDWAPLLADPMGNGALAPILALAQELQPKRGRTRPIDEATREQYLDLLGIVAVDIKRFFGHRSRERPLGEPDSIPGLGLDLGDRLRPGGDAPHWELGWIPVPARIEAEPDTRLVAALIVTESGRIVRLTPEVNPPSNPPRMARLLAREVEAAIAADGAPPTIWLRDQASATALRRLPGLRRTILEVVETLPAFDLVRTDFDHQFGAESGEAVAAAPTWTGWGLDAGLVAGIFGAAAALYRAAPWRLYSDPQPLVVRWPSGDSWIVSVMGAAGIDHGLFCFTDPGDVTAGLRDNSSTPRLRGTAVTLSYEPQDDLPPAMRKDIMNHRWEVAAPEAYPMILAINSPTAGLTATVAEQLRQVAEVLSRFGSTKGRRRTGTWRDRATGIEIDR